MGDPFHEIPLNLLDRNPPWNLLGEEGDVESKE